MDTPQDRACVKCGYDLRAISSDRCPECGTWFDATGELTPTLPWAHRWRLGRVRAYWKTVWLLTGRPSRLGAELSRTVDLAGAKSFRRVTVAITFLSLAVSGYFARWIWFEQQGGTLDSAIHTIESLSEDGLGEFAGFFLWGWSFWISLLVLLLSLFSLGASPRWFVQRRTMDTVRWNRAGALAPYTCAPLALMPVAVGISWAIYFIVPWINKNWLNDAYELFDWEWIGLMAGAPAFLFVMWIWLIVSLMRRTTECGKRRGLAVATVLPLLWGGIAVLIFTGAHAAAVLFVLLFRRS